MSDLGFTPGPYYVDRLFGEGLHDICLGYEIPGEGSPVLIASAFGESGRAITPAKAAANARLFAAAPELYAALEELLNALECKGKADMEVQASGAEYGGDNDEVWDAYNAARERLSAARDAARAALAKARGGQEG